MNKYRNHCNFLLTFAELSGKSSAGIPVGAAVGKIVLPTVASTAPAVILRTVRQNHPQLFQVWSRHSWPARANEGLFLLGCFRGAHIGPRKAGYFLPTVFSGTNRTRQIISAASESILATAQKVSLKVPNPRSAGLQRGAHNGRNCFTTLLSGSYCLGVGLRVAGHPHSANPYKQERQPLPKKDERYGGGVS